jgi:hypothetical protein
LSLLLTSFIYTDQVGATYTINDCYNIIIDMGDDIKNNTMKVKLKNPTINVLSDGTIRHEWVGSDGQIEFQPVRTSKKMIMDQELIDCYCTYTDTNPSLTVYSSDYLIYSGVISKGEIRSNTGENTIELTCLDRTSVAMDRLTLPQSYTITDGWTAPTVIKNIIQNCSEQDMFKAYSSSGIFGPFYPYHIDAALFSERIKASGTPTSVSQNKLIDSGASFLSTVEKDFWVRNTVTNQYSYVISVDSNSQLTLGKDIFTSANAYQVSNGFIQSSRPDGSAFPAIGFSVVNKPINESISKVGSTFYTNSYTELNTPGGSLTVQLAGKYFIDKKARFHWYIPSDTPDYYMEVGTIDAISPDLRGHKILDITLDNETRGLVNFIIYKAGEDMNNIMIKGAIRAPFSGTPQTKESLQLWNHIARDMKLEEARVGHITQTSSDTFSYPGSYPMTPTWYSSPVANNTAYNTAFKDIANKRAKALAMSIFQRLANPRWGGKIMIRGEPINVGDLIHFSSNEHGIKNILVRVTQVTHSIDAEQGWITTLNVIEDENRLIKGVV